MALVQTSTPADEPLTVEEAKAHLRVDGSADDVLIGSLILTSRLHIEAALGLALISQSWKVVLDAWPKAGDVLLPLWPILDVDEVRVLAADGTPSVVDPDVYIVDTASRPCRIVRRRALPSPGRLKGGIEIDLTTGFGESADDVPSPIRQALLLLVAHWYERRDPLDIGAPSTRIPDAVSSLLEPYRLKRV
jgi:uncharacterized phiE125 gp8 family phage protein